MGIDTTKPFPKRPRLSDFDYLGSYAYFITILTHDRSPFFKAAAIVDTVANYLFETGRLRRFKVICYCFMPDHLHLLPVGEDGNSNLKSFIALFKQKSGYRFKKNYREDLWHVSYYDHVLRKDESIEGVSRYILENPVRRGLVSDFRDYPFSRSFLDLSGLKP